MHTSHFITFLLLSSVSPAHLAPVGRHGNLRRQEELPPIGSLISHDIDQLDLDQMIKPNPPNQKLPQRRQPPDPNLPPIGPFIPINSNELGQFIPYSPLDQQIPPPLPPKQLESANKPLPIDQQFLPPSPLGPLEPGKASLASDQRTSTPVPTGPIPKWQPPMRTPGIPIGTVPEWQPPKRTGGNPSKTTPEWNPPCRTGPRAYDGMGVAIDWPRESDICGPDADRGEDLYLQHVAFDGQTKCPQPYHEFCCYKLDYSGMQAKCVGPGPVRQLEDCLRFHPHPMCCCGFNPLPRGLGLAPHDATFSCDPKCRALNMKNPIKKLK